MFPFERVADLFDHFGFLFLSTFFADAPTQPIQSTAFNLTLDK